MERKDKEVYEARQDKWAFHESGVDYKCLRPGGLRAEKENCGIKAHAEGIKRRGGPLLPGKKSEKGSVTVEAAMLLPLVIMISMAVISFLGIIGLQIRLQGALEEAAQRLSKAAYIEDMLLSDEGQGGRSLGSVIAGFAERLLIEEISEEYAKSMVVENAGEEYLDRSCIRGGSEGLSLSIGMVSDAAGLIDLVASYEVELPFFPGASGTLGFMQRAVRKKWTGLGVRQKKESFIKDDQDEDDDEDERQTEDEKEKVYVTKTGTVYHLFSDCRVLRIVVKRAEASDMADKRNDGGGKYYPCERCVRGDVAAMVFYTPDGDRFHNSRECGSLNRYIKEVTKDEAAGRPLCKFCGSRQLLMTEEKKAA